MWLDRRAAKAQRLPSRFCRSCCCQQLIGAPDMTVHDDQYLGCRLSKVRNKYLRPGPSQPVGLASQPDIKADARADGRPMYQLRLSHEVEQEQRVCTVIAPS